jgi:hypothetical protein
VFLAKVLLPQEVHRRAGATLEAPINDVIMNDQPGLQEFDGHRSVKNCLSVGSAQAQIPAAEEQWADALAPARCETLQAEGVCPGERALGQGRQILRF